MVKSFLYISPQFPLNYTAFVSGLKRCGVRVLGIGSDRYGDLPQRLKEALTEYYQVPNMDDYGRVLEAGRYFQGKYGRIDRVESHAEYWLPLDAALRDELDVWGLRRADLPLIRNKSQMKEAFRRAGVDVARGILADSLETAQRFVQMTGYPVVLKPDAGVGAYGACRIGSDAELESFFAKKPPVPYFMEEFVQGGIETFDGLTDREGEISYCNSLTYSQNIMEVLNADDHVAYWTARDLPPDLEAAGRAAVRAFGIRERFFHLEFFRRRGNGRLLGLEVNMRPPGGLTTDMWNYADDIDLYFAWARLVSEGVFDTPWRRRFHCGYIGRKDNIRYRQSHEELVRRCGPRLMHWERISGIFRGALGDAGYVVRSESLDEIKELIGCGHERA